MENTRHIVAILLVCCGYFANAQVVEHFTDGNFNSNPAWVGDDSLFQVNTAKMLQSKGTTGTSKDISLATGTTSIDSAEWQCLVRFNLSPSSQNFCRFYLTSDQANLKGSLNGYYVQFGGVTGNTDSITLYKQKGLSHTRVIGGRPGTVSKSNNLVRVKVVRDKLGNWQLLSDTAGGNSFIPEGMGSDNEFTSTAWCGYFVRFTSGNVANYYLDDVQTGPIVIDTIAPLIDSVTVISPSSLRVRFSESVDPATGLDPNSYTVDNLVGPAVGAQFETGSTNVVILQFFNSFSNGTTYMLTATGIMDVNNNMRSSDSRSFLYHVPQKEDVLITEFFPDPDPTQGLPALEFVELYNRSSYPVQLKDWVLTDGSANALLPAIELQPDSFIILCASANVSSFSGHGLTAGLSGFPTLNNSGDALALKDNFGNLVHVVTYDLSWYADQTKQDGGWTIEMKNPFDLCRGKGNFAASTNTQGGTPGKANSAWSKTPDLVPPQLLSATILTPSSVVLHFNEKMDSTSLTSAGIAVSGGATATGRAVRGESHDSLELTISPALVQNTSYSISVSNARDCMLNNIAPNSSKSVIYFLPDTARAYDIVIHEIMADPDPAVGLPAYEYVELHNKSAKILSLKNWTIEDATSKALFPDMVLLPDSFLIVCGTSAQSALSAHGAAAGLTGFPSLGNDADELTLKDAQGRIIHHVLYSIDWYRDNIKKNGGWSLEMMDADNPCAQSENWIASKNNSGGTPGKVNSARATNKDMSPPRLLKAYPLNNKAVRLFFNESLDTTTLTGGNISVNPFGNATSVQLQPAAYSSFTAQFADSFLTRNAYRAIVANVKDCAGNPVGDYDHADFGLPEDFDSGEVVINEVLFNPRTGGVDFVELYNRSQKVIDLSRLFIANANEDNSVNDMYPVSMEGFLLFPGAYCALTTDPGILKNEYFSSNTGNFIMCSMPSFSDDKGVVIILDAPGKRYDQLNYDDDMHFPLLDDKNGVSLERIDYKRPAGDRTNWTSASTRVFATPAYRNSQFMEANANGARLSADPEVFSPDGDGYKDVVNFSYTMEEGGFTGNLFLYDSRGVMVKHLLRNEILGATGTFSWNGTDERNAKAPIGIYMAYLEVFNLKGEIKKYRTVLVLSGKL